MLLAGRVPRVFTCGRWSRYAHASLLSADAGLTLRWPPAYSVVGICSAGAERVGTTDVALAGRSGFRAVTRTPGAPNHGCGSRRKGRTRRVTIGRHGEITPTFARAEAKRLLGEIAAGRDPAAERDKTRAGRSLAVVLDQFMAEHVRPKLKASTATEYERTARLYVVPRVGRRPIAELTRQDVAKLHHEMANTPYQANRTLALLSKFFNWAEKHGLRPDGSNPCRHVEKIGRAHV